jgi:hypothetical protein
MTTPQAALISSLIIGASIIGAKLIAPYQLASGNVAMWRLNTVTGSVTLCNPGVISGAPLNASACK